MRKKMISKRKEQKTEMLTRWNMRKSASKMRRQSERSFSQLIADVQIRLGLVT